MDSLTSKVWRYRTALQALLPPGVAWSRDPERVLTKLLNGFAGVFGAIDSRIDHLLSESDPRTSLEMLPEWENAVGLPDPCLGLAPSDVARRERLLSGLIPPDSSSRIDMSILASSLGYEGCYVIEPTFFRTNSNCNDSCYSENWAFTWILAVPIAATVRLFTTTSTCRESLASWQHELLECVFRDISPIHTTVLFSYGGSSL